MTLDRTYRTKCFVKRSLVGAVSGFAIFAGVLASGVQADPAEDALAKLNELSRQAEQTTEAMHSAELDLSDKLVVQQAADAKHQADLDAMQVAQTQLATFQSAVDKVAAAQYMGGRTDGLDAILTAPSPQALIDQLAVQRVMAVEMTNKMTGFRASSEQAAAAEQTSAASAAAAKTAAEQAAAVRADLQAKQSQLQVQIAIVKAQYEALTPGQREALATAPPPPPLPAAPAPDAVPPPNDPSILAAPPAGIPPGDIAPPAAVVPGPPAPGGEAAVAVQAALSRIGSPYVWGGSGPNQFDCSGLVMWAFQQAGLSLPHSSQALARGGQPVSMDQMQPGDLVTYYSDASHVGIYIGDGMMVHASTYGQPVRVAPVDNAPIYNVRRY